MVYFIRPYPVFAPRPVAPCAMSFCSLWGLLRQFAVNSPFRAQTTARFGCASPRAINKARQWPLGQTSGMTKIKDIAELPYKYPRPQPGTESVSNFWGTGFFMNDIG